MSKAQNNVFFGINFKSQNIIFFGRREYFLVDLPNTLGFVVESFVISSFPNMIELCFLVDPPDTPRFVVESFVISSFSNMPQSC